jgi:excinuclease ABC subunit C
MGAMEVLKNELKLKELPKRIEGYDISNISGTFIVASMVVFINGEPYNKHYRKFKIQTVVGNNNDFESMKEVLTRRILNLNSDDESFKNAPNLILIDGGKGQLGYAYDVLKTLNQNIDIVSLAKKQEEIFAPNKTNSIVLSKDNSGLKLLQNVRDEAHRFAITFHRSLRNKNTLKSELSNIDGVGEITIKKLFNHFKSIDKIKNATLEELTEVKGINKTTALNIVNYFLINS